MAFLATLVSSIAPIFLILSPVTSYTDQILSIHRTHTSAGFSLDIPLIMLTASILKVFYWPGSRYDFALLVQACNMIAVQLILLKVALDNRPPVQHRSHLHPPFSDIDITRPPSRRPWNFWRWRSQRPYWEYVGGLALLLLLCQTIFKPSPPPSPPLPSITTSSSDYSALYTLTIGYLGLAIEAILPIPQLLANQRARSCKGFRVSVLANWLVGDALKMGFFVLAGENRVPWAFKLCGAFQAGCDLGLGWQWWVFGDGEGGVGAREREKLGNGWVG